jgi:hypothetical protein
VKPATAGDPMRPVRWGSKGHEKLAAALCAMGHKIKKSSIPKLPSLLKYRRLMADLIHDEQRKPAVEAIF